jgi:2-polyprenyl-3-methyl-5-hydroxy-6-metoxy-1,4-benzoquinol methylase
LLDAAGIRPEASVLDVGAGASRLVDALLKQGFTDLTALDVADEGLALARARLGAAADRVRWITADLLTWEPGRTFDVWHDRAVFHFLTEPTARGRYRGLLAAAVPAGGTVIVATFAEDGPAQCSGLDVCRYDPASLHAELGPSFDLVTSRRQEHVTPWGAVQPFTWVVLRAGT